MDNDIKELRLPLKKVLVYGEVDKWLRGVSGLAPVAADPGHGVSQEKDLHTALHIDVTYHDFNTHTLSYGSGQLIDENDIEKMVGFRQLISACSKNNVCLEISNLGQGNLEVSFDPERLFSSSRIFGASYANVLPVLFGVRKNSPSP